MGKMKKGSDVKTGGKCSNHWSLKGQRSYVLTAVHKTIESGGKNPHILITALYPVSSNYDSRIADRAPPPSPPLFGG